jgi:hypothetical protein
MKYFFLSEVGDNYKDEEGTEGLRVDTLEGLAKKLRLAMVNLENLVAEQEQLLSAPSMPQGKAKRRYDDDASEDGASPSAQGGKPLPRSGFARMGRKAGAGMAGRMSKINAATAEVERQRQWLERQGCVVGADGTIDWGLSHRKVEYDHELAQQGLTRLDIQGGLLYLQSKPLDTTGMVTHVSGPGHCVYVMSATGNFHVSSHSVGHRHHSSMLTGHMVAGAGEMKCLNGQLQLLTNKSGHYRPTVAHLLQTLHQLQKKQVPMTFSLMVYPEKVLYPTVDAFVKSLNAKGQQDFELARLLRYHKHLRNDVLGAHQPDRWRWCDGSDGKAVGVYSELTGAAVAHKAVRQWLKSQGKFAALEVQSGQGR